MKKVKGLKVAEHGGDITYERFVSFKMLAPQFWERMDSPLWMSYYEGIKDFFNKGDYWSAMRKIDDYGFAIKNAEAGNDAWGMCFSLITYEEGEDQKSCPDESEMRAKLQRAIDTGITWKEVRDAVMGFMKASPEVFTDHIIANDILSTQSEEGS